MPWSKEKHQNNEGETLTELRESYYGVLLCSLIGAETLTCPKTKASEGAGRYQDGKTAFC